MNSASNKSKSLCLRVSVDEYNYIIQQAHNTNLSINTYIKKQVLDTTGGRGTQHDRIMQLIPGLYCSIDSVENVTVRKELKKKVSQLCQYLK